jgi:hypothetical protein
MRETTINLQKASTSKTNPKTQRTRNNIKTRKEKLKN